MGNANAQCDHASSHITIIDVPAFLAGFLIATAGKLGMRY
jgi:hypothetical protein